MIKLAICDDDREVGQKLQEMIKGRYGMEILTHIFSDAASLMKFMDNEEEENPQIILMDIKLGEANGIQLAKSIQECFPFVKILFITGYIDYAADIFEAEPVYFLVKPVTAEKLFIAIDKAKEKIMEGERSVFFHTKEAIIQIPVKQVIYIESEGRRLIVHQLDKSIIVNEKLNNLEKRMPHEFLRCHQSFIVNMDKIHRFEKRKIILSWGGG